jgi:hypothetical protein
MTGSMLISGGLKEHCGCLAVLGATLAPFICVVLLCSGCVTSGFELFRRSHSPGESAVGESRPHESGLVDSSSRAVAKHDTTSTEETQDATGPARTPGSAKIDVAKASQGERTKSSSIDEKLDEEAMKLARNLAPVEKVRLCYVRKDDEWWLTVYKDIGSSIDARQFVWNWEKDEFAPFLVLKRIPRSKMEAELNRKDRENTCRLLAPPPVPADSVLEKAWENPEPSGK